jgi:hypothetical protein
MELAEEARLERDAATSTTAALRQQLEATQVRRLSVGRQLQQRPRSVSEAVWCRVAGLCCNSSCLCEQQSNCITGRLQKLRLPDWHPLHLLPCLQARLADVSKQLLGGSAADGGLGAAELRQKLSAAEREAARANRAAGEAEAKVSAGGVPRSCGRSWVLQRGRRPAPTGLLGRLRPRWVLGVGARFDCRVLLSAQKHIHACAQSPGVVLLVLLRWGFNKVLRDSAQLHPQSCEPLKSPLSCCLIGHVCMCVHDAVLLDGYIRWLSCRRCQQS